ncbi:MAG TPA: bifunctional precorrin-2 dehydrogenase/sirohydrochlorin ferrochelatase [Limnochordales bacterium]
MATFYPVLLQLAGRPCVVIGGGPVAEAKVAALLRSQACVTVVAPELTPALAQWAAQGQLRWVPREYLPGDLSGAFLAIAATDDPRTNERIWQEAEQRRVLLNAVDDVSHCHFIAPAVHRQGDITVAVSTNGQSPALAVLVRDRIASLIGPEYGELASILGEMRAEVNRRLPDPESRKALWQAVLAAGALELVREGRPDDLRRRIRELARQMAGESCAEEQHPR